MKILLLKENKNEYRVGLTPDDVKHLIKDGHHVDVEKGAGNVAGYLDGEYTEAGAIIVSSSKKVVHGADVIIKLSELSKDIILAMNKKQLLISQVCLANNPAFLRKLLFRQITCIDLNCVNDDGEYVFAIPSEQIKGRFAALSGSYFLSKTLPGGMGVSFTPINNSKTKALFVVLNCSYAGYEAARTILALGADLTILENDEKVIKDLLHDEKFKALAALYKSEFKVAKAGFEVLEKIMPMTSVFINTNQLPGSKSNKRITGKMIDSMPKGAIYIDVCTDQGFGSETIKKPTSIEKPVGKFSHQFQIALDNVPSLYNKTLSESVSSLVTSELLKHHKDIEKSLL
jgi:alanine dehydrogenase